MVSFFQWFLPRCLFVTFASPLLASQEQLPLAHDDNALPRVIVSAGSVEEQTLFPGYDRHCSASELNKMWNNRPKYAASFCSDSEHTGQLLREQHTPKRMSKSRRGLLQLESIFAGVLTADEALLKKFMGIKGTIMPNPVNTADHTTWNENCALVAIAGALGLTSGEIFSAYANIEETSYQSQNAFLDTALDAHNQRQNMHQFLQDLCGSRLTQHQNLSSEEEALSLMRGFPHGTRLVIDLGYHFVSGFVFEGSVVTVDYQTNVLKEVPPMVAVNHLNPQNHPRYASCSVLENIPHVESGGQISLDEEENTPEPLCQSGLPSCEVLLPREASDYEIDKAEFISVGESAKSTATISFWAIVPSAR